MELFNHTLKEHPSIIARMCLVTPKDAEAFLLRNTHNRRIGKAVVETYVKQMEYEAWFPSSAGIGFDEDGVLLDGQHRLAAIVLMGKPQWLLVVDGLPRAAQVTVDRQRKRSLADVFFLDGTCKDIKTVQTAVYMVRKATGDRGVCDAEVKAMIALCADSLAAIHKVAKHEPGVSVVGVRAALVEAHGLYGTSACEFFQKLQNPLHSDLTDPIFRLRNWLLSSTKTIAAHSGEYQRAAYRRTCYAFNAWQSGKKIVKVLEADGINVPRQE